MLDDMIDAWRANNAISLELLGLCPDETFEFKPGKGKTIRSNFVHIVSVRRMKLEERGIPGSKTLPKLDWKTATRQEIREGLSLTSDLMPALFEKQIEKPNRFSAAKLLAYLVAHEAHHRSQIEIALRLNEAEPDDMKLFALWDWSKK